MQVMMNLFSNALKFTGENGKIHLHAVWYPLDTAVDLLLSPIKTVFESSATESLFNQSTRSQHRTQNLSNKEEKEEMIEEFDQEDLSLDRLNLRAFGDVQGKSLSDYNASKDSTNKSES